MGCLRESKKKKKQDFRNGPLDEIFSSFDCWVQSADQKPKITHWIRCCGVSFQHRKQFYCSSATQLCLTLCHPRDCSRPSFPSFTISQSLLKLTSIMSMMPSNHFILCCFLLLLPSVFLSWVGWDQNLFCWVGSLHQEATWPLPKGSNTWTLCLLPL